MNFNVDTSIPIGVIPTSNGNFIGLVYSNVLESSLATYLPLSSGTLSGNLGIGNTVSSLNTSYILNVNSYINVSSNITARSNIITSNINSITINNSSLIRSGGLISGPISFTSNLTQTNTDNITFKGFISIASNLSFNAFNVIGEPPVANVSLLGGLGSRIIFRNAKSQTQFPDAIGINNETLWLSSSNIGLYLNGVNQFNINSNGIVTISNQINQIKSDVNNYFLGSVGIATSTVSPDHKLNVNGAINSTSINTGSLVVNGLNISSGIADSSLNSSNYASNISNVLNSNSSNYASNISNVLNRNSSNYASNISNVLNINSSNYASNISNVLNINSSNYASNISNVLNINSSNYASNISNVLNINSSNYASNISNVIITNSSNYASNISNVLNINSSNYASNISNVIITNSSNYASNISNVIITNSSNYASNISNVLNINSSNYASNISNVIITNSSNYASNISNVIITNSSNYASNISNVIITNSSNYASNISNVLNINSSNYASNISNVLNINSSNYASNISNVIITNSSNYASNISNVIITNSSNYASNISNVLNINSSNYASNISNVLLTSISGSSFNYTFNISNILNSNSSNYASNISNVLNINSSNYASNISNVIITNSSNYASNISNVIITNSSNYASNISNVLNINSSNYASNISNVLNINSSNYASNISNVLNINSSNYASNISNVLNINSSNYASNISNVLNINSSNYASNISNVLNINSSNYASNISNVLNINSSNYASNISNVLNINSSNYASNISNVLNINSSNYASNISNVLNINSSNYASNISNVLNRNSSNYASNISNVLNINSSNYASNISNVLNINSSNYASNISNIIITNSSNYAMNISNILLTIVKYNSPISNINNIVSLNLDNTTQIQYPPAAMTSETTTFSSSSYKNNGIYTVSSSTSLNIINSFNYLTTGTQWTSTASVYRTTSPFDYTSTIFTISNGNTSHFGEWIQLYYDRGFAVNRVDIYGTNSTNSPSGFVLAGSIDGNYWNLLSKQTGISSIYSSNNINNYTSYNYYRTIFTNLIGNAAQASIQEIQFYGLPNTTYVNTDNFNTIIYNTTEKQFPPRLYDTSSAETNYVPSTGYELFGVAPSTVYKETLTLNNHGIYTIYSSTTYSINNTKKLLFNFIFNGEEGAHWATVQYTTSGIYSANTSYIKSDFKGDWIIIKLPYKIVLSRFRFYNRTACQSRAPGSWKCYGSNDGINFTEITEASNYQTSLTINNYALGYYEQLISSLFDIPYLYIGWVFNKLVGSDTMLNFNELQIFGKDDISNSYSKALTLLSDNRLIYNNISTITTYLTTANAVNLTNKYVRFNYEDEVYINSGTYNLTFGGGSNSINTSPAITKYTYPILKDSDLLNIINPLIWYKFDSTANLLIDNGSLNNGNLTNSGNPVSYYQSPSALTPSLIHGSGMAYFASGTYLTVPNTIDLNAINLATGISFNLWVNITAAGNYGRIFDFGTTDGTSGTNYIIISREATNPNLKFEIYSGTSTSFVTSGTTYINTGWYNISWSITTTGVWSIYINGVALLLNNVVQSSSGSVTGVSRLIPSISTVANRTYYIGKSLFSNDGFLTMYMDDFRIYGKVLSQTEVTELYKGRVEVYTKNTIGIGTTNPNTNCILDVNGNTNISGNVGIGTTNPEGKLTVEGRAIVGNGSSTYTSPFNVSTGLTIANAAGSGNPEQLVVCDTANTNCALLIGNKYNAGTAYSTIQSLVAGAGYKTISLNPSGGNVGIGTTDPKSHLEVVGKANIHNGSPVGYFYMQSGSLTIGGTNANYGGQYYTGGSWIGTNTAGLLMECSDNTEIVVHDYNTKLASLMYYEGAGTNRITIGRDMGWGAITTVAINGNVGIGKLLTNCRLYISANLATSATVYAMRLSCGTSTDNGGFGTLLGLGSEDSGWSKCAIGHTRMSSYDQGDIVFLTRATADNADCAMSDEKMRITSIGRIGIGTNNPGNILQVGSAGRLRISNGTADYSLIGTLDSDGATNTRIVISGTTRASPYAGNIEYYGTSTGAHIFYTTDSATEKMRINSTGNVGIGNPTPIGILSIGRPDTISDGTLTISKNASAGASRNFKMGFDDSFNFCIGDFGNTTSIATNTWSSTQLTINYSNGNIGIGTVQSGFKLSVNGGVNIFTTVTNDPVGITFKDTNYNIGIAGSANHYSSSAIAGDMIIRTIANNNLLLQSGGNGYGLKIDTANNVNCSGTVTAAGFSGPLTGNCSGSSGSCTGSAASLTSGDKTINGILTVNHASTIFNGSSGGLYVYNPNNSMNNCSVLGVRIAGTSANKAGISLDVSGLRGWSIYINGNDTNSWLRFNSSWDGTNTDNTYEKLKIQGTDGYTNLYGSMTVGSGTNGAILTIGNSVNATTLHLTDAASSAWKIITGTSLSFQNSSTGSFATKMSLSSAGLLTVNDDVIAFGGLSDKRLKINITDLSINCIDLINKLKSVEFTWIDNYRIPERKRHTIDHGFIAQEIEELLPNLVNNEGTYKSLKYEKLTTYLVKAFQQQNVIILDQNNKINDLQNQINLIKSHLNL